MNKKLVTTDPEEAAEAAGLVYVSDFSPGIRRRRAGRGYTYWDAGGTRITDEDTLARIKALAIPPAWTDVWISANPNGHIQATGRDDRGRKQYRYHARWHEQRSAEKFGRLAAFGRALPEIRDRIEHDLSRRGLPREKVLAVVVKLLDLVRIRIGNREYARANKSFGLTTMRDRHAKIQGTSVQFKFRGKSGKQHTINVKDRRLARIVKRCQDVPGQELFQYVDDAGQPQDIHSHDVNDYLREISGQDFTAKDFRTWSGTLLGLQCLQNAGPAENKTQAKRQVASMVRQVAEELGNTPTICRKYYIDPAVVQAFSEGRLFDLLELVKPVDIPGLEPDEDILIALLEALEEK